MCSVLPERFNLLTIPALFEYKYRCIISRFIAMLEEETQTIQSSCKQLGSMVTRKIVF